MRTTAARFQGLGTSVFTTFTERARATGAVNLGQGFPDFDGPEFVKEAAVRAVHDGHNQYAPSFGLPALRRAVVEHRQRFTGERRDPETEVTITAGATEALFAAVLGLCEPGDEVLLFEPFYDAYLAAVRAAGGVVRAVPLAPPGFALDVAALRAAVGPRTRLVVLNTPHNPTGKVWTSAELEALSALAAERDLVVLSDEVYEHLVYEGRHLTASAAGAFRERTVVISSGGKTFSLTGWKVGWAIAPPPLTAAVRAAHQFITFCTPAPLQLGIAAGLAAPDAYFEELLQGYAARRRLLTDALAAAGLSVLAPAGAYFACVDAAPLGLTDVALVERLLAAGVLGIPCSAFQLDPARPGRLVRLAFCKREATLRAAVAALARL